MASASSHSCEEQLLCSICLDPVTEPVSTPCGHNYCKTCITGYWATSDMTQCPFCKEMFTSRPQLQVNTMFRDMVEHFNNIKVRGEDEFLDKPGEVPCDVCLGLKLKAQKTCLVCLASYCSLHLEPHERVSALKKHKLINPVSDLKDKVCEKHDKIFEFFCRVDQICVCYMCLKDDHVTHEATPLEDVFRERKGQLQNVTSEIHIMENSKCKSITEIKSSVEQGKRDSQEEIGDVVMVLTDLGTFLQISQCELMEVIQEKQKAAEKQAEDQVRQLEQEIAKLRRRRSEIEQLLETEDHLRLLQRWPSLHFLAHNEDLTDPLSLSSPPLDISHQTHRAIVKKAVAQMANTLRKEMEMLIHKVRLCDEATEEPDVWNPPQDKLMMIQQCNAVDVTLDTYTANSRLKVSEDGKQLTFRQSRWFFHSVFWRGFHNEVFVLGKEGFSSGRFYYEVQVSRSNGWLVGVVKEPVNNQGWTFCGPFHNQFEEEYFVNSTPLYLRQRPQTIGVFVDYEKGEVSFYDVDARTLIYSFTGCTFTETVPALQAFLYSLTGTPSVNRPKLFPIFNIFGDENDILVITPVQ